MSEQVAAPQIIAGGAKLRGGARIPATSPASSGGAERISMASS
jgi:3-deoxy-D-arabino-heptulosonate 7-phosphate (DAHP) synthase